jgi:hypothetical protein
LFGFPVCGQSAVDGTAGLSQLISSGQSQSVFCTGHGSGFLQSHSGKAFLHLLQFGVGITFSIGHAGPVTTGNASAGAGVLHGQAAITGVKEQVDIPTAIAAATVSFLIVIFTSLFV